MIISIGADFITLWIQSCGEILNDFGAVKDGKPGSPNFRQSREYWRVWHFGNGRRWLHDDLRIKRTSICVWRNDHENKKEFPRGQVIDSMTAPANCEALMRALNCMEWMQIDCHWSYETRWRWTATKEWEENAFWWCYAIYMNNITRCQRFPRILPGTRCRVRSHECQIHTFGCSGLVMKAHVVVEVAAAWADSSCEAPVWIVCWRMEEAWIAWYWWMLGMWTWRVVSRWRDASALGAAICSTCSSPCNQFDLGRSRPSGPICCPARDICAWGANLRRLSRVQCWDWVPSNWSIVRGTGADSCLPSGQRLHSSRQCPPRRLNFAVFCHPRART